MRRALGSIRRKWVAPHSKEGTLASPIGARSGSQQRIIPWKQAIAVGFVQNKNQFGAGFVSYAFRSYLAGCTSVPVAFAYHDVMEVKPTLWRLIAEAALLVFRAVYLFLLFSPTLILISFAEYFPSRIRELWLQLLLATLQNAGPAFIKWGQWAATRPDMFAVDVCERLSKLHNKAPQHSFEETKETIESAFGAPLEEIFESFIEEPEASGSIAQVHRAKLKSKRGAEQQTVAVKVRHPSVLTTIQRDFQIIELLSRVSTLIPGLKHLQLDKTARQFSAFMTQQVDLSLEAVHLMRFIYNFRNSEDIVFPKPKYPLVHPAVLVESYEEGRSISEYIVENHRSKLHTRLAELGTRTLLKMLLEDNFVHGDLHPGNVFVRRSGDVPELVVVDGGMTAELGDKSRDILLGLFKGVSERDGSKVAECCLAFSDKQDCPDPEEFKRDVDLRFKKHLAKSSSAQSTGECMTELFDEIRKHHVNIDGDVCTVMVTTLVLEGWQRKLDPNFDILTVLGSLLYKLQWLNSLEYVMLAIASP